MRLCYEEERMRKDYWRQHSGQLEPIVKDAIDGRVMRYLSSWPEGLSTARMAAWIQSCSRGGGYTPQEYEGALRELRDSGRIAIANGTWYVRKQLQ